MEDSNKTKIKTAVVAFLITFLMASCLSLSGCNFFGKKADELDTSAPGTLANGASIVGSWSASYTQTAVDRRPAQASTSTYVFDPTGKVTIRIQEAHGDGIQCAAYGQYRRINASDFVIYIQALENDLCTFNSQFVMTDVQVNKNSLSFKSASQRFVYFADRAQTAAPVGLWDFHASGADAKGENGIDFAFIDPSGYFIFQTTENKTQYLLQGFYTIQKGKLTFWFFEAQDPSKVLTGAELVFEQYITDGKSLDLIGRAANGEAFVYSGQKL